MSSNLFSRVLVAAVAIPAALAVVYVGGWALTSALAVLGVAGVREAYRLAESGGVKPMVEIGFAGAVAGPFALFVVSPGGLDRDPLWLLLGGAVWLMLVMLLASRNRPIDQRPLACAAITVFAVLYSAYLLSLLLLIRHPSVPLTSWAATWLVFLPLAVVWICDTLAMAVGSAIGGAKLTPVLSPNKTWAGAVAGTVGGVLAAPLYGWLVLWPTGVSISALQLMAFGLVVSVVGQAGDIAESLLKREAGRKDSGTFFGGHGGVLDRLDSLYWAIPTSVIALTAFGVI